MNKKRLTLTGMHLNLYLKRLSLLPLIGSQISPKKKLTGSYSYLTLRSYLLLMKDET
jgi:hypothetical protein